MSSEKLQPFCLSLSVLINSVKKDWEVGNPLGSLLMLGSSYLEKSGLILGLRPANERCCYKVTPSLIGWVQT